MTRDEYNLRRERGICVGDKSCPNPHAPGATICEEHQARANGVVNAVRRFFVASVPTFGDWLRVAR